MNAKNNYLCPLNKKHIKFIVTKKSPAHKIFKLKNGVIWDERNAIDFVCDEGTPIKASSSGQVASILNKINKNYKKMKFPSKRIMKEEETGGNWIVIKHRNKEFSMYCHLKKNGILVKKMQKVKRGEVIGYSGNTGWSILPHLHFMVFRFTKPLPAADLETLKIKFR